MAKVIEERFENWQGQDFDEDTLEPVSYTHLSNESEAKWQFAAYLPECSCSQEVRDIILDFAKDPNEYVSRRALLAMPALRPDCVEQFAPLFWERNCYSPELQEYQRIAVLVDRKSVV